MLKQVSVFDKLFHGSKSADDTFKKKVWRHFLETFQLTPWAKPPFSGPTPRPAQPPGLWLQSPTITRPEISV